MNSLCSWPLYVASNNVESLNDKAFYVYVSMSVCLVIYMNINKVMFYVLIGILLDRCQLLHIAGLLYADEQMFF